MKKLSLVALALALVACDAPKDSKDSKDSTSESAKADGKKGDTKPAKAEAKSEWTKLDKVGLQAQLPEMSQVSDAIGGGGVMIVGLAPVNILDGKDKPKTIEAAKKDAEMFNPTNFKEEKLSDGWILTFENKGSMGTNYWLKARREIDGKPYVCETSVSKPEQVEGAIKICKSLKK